MPLPPKPPPPSPSELLRDAQLRQYLYEANVAKSRVAKQRVRIEWLERRVHDLEVIAYGKRR
jgi:polyhydroxyalkanoate synthesis regulator phasin